jgi:TetR/AcrR family transcriptional regulator, transcriptional repressor for nem operon
LARPRNFDPSAVLDTAVATFWKHGFDGTAVEALCDVMNLGPGSLYGAFGGKRELFLTALDRYMEQVSKDAIQRIAAPASGMEGIRAYFGNLVDAIADGRRLRGCLLTNSLIELGDRDPVVSEKVILNMARLETAFAGALTRASAAGEIAAEPGAKAAGYLVCVVQGLNVLANTRPSRQMLEHIVVATLRAL